MDEDLKLTRRLRNWRTISDFTEIDRLIAATDATITRLHAENEALKSDVSDLVRAGSDEATENERLVKERDRCHARLEIDHCYQSTSTGDGKPVRVEIPLSNRGDYPDGIDCRDDTIAMLQVRAETAEAENERLVKERDEARAEIALWNGKAVALESDELDGLAAKWPRVVKVMLDAERRAETAEAQRNAALEFIKGPEAWLDRWADHVGACAQGDRCTCGLTLARHEIRAASRTLEGE